MRASNVICGFNSTYCCVPQCTNGAWKNPNLSFHTFPRINPSWPKDQQDSALRRRNAWIRVLRMGKKITHRMVVCSSHFQESDYILPYRQMKRRCLKRNAIPSLNLPVSLPENEKNAIPVKSKRKVVKSCCVKNCKTYQKTGSDIVFHKFPLKNEELTRKWVKNIQKNFVPTNYHYVCSKHFTSDSYMKGYVNRLKDDAIPMIFDNLKKQKKQVKKTKKVTNGITLPSTEEFKEYLEIKPDPYNLESIKKTKEATSTVTLTSAEEFDGQYLEIKPDISSLSATISNTIALDSCKIEQDSSDWTAESVLQMPKEITDNETATDSEEEMNSFLENGYLDTQEILKEKLKKFAAHYKKTRAKLKEYQQKCELYVKKVTTLEQVINSLRQINSVKDDNYLEENF